MFGDMIEKQKEMMCGGVSGEIKGREEEAGGDQKCAPVGFGSGETQVSIFSQTPCG